MLKIILINFRLICVTFAFQLLPTRKAKRKTPTFFTERRWHNERK